MRASHVFMSALEGKLRMKDIEPELFCRQLRDMPWIFGA